MAEAQALETSLSNIATPCLLKGKKMYYITKMSLFCDFITKNRVGEKFSKLF
jgi:hypothetical protein